MDSLCPPERFTIIAMATIYYTASSLDGYIADRTNSLEWLFQFGDPEETSYPEFIKGVGALAMGSTTYQWLLDHHLKPGTGEAKPWPYEQPAWIFSTRRLERVEGNLHYVSGDVRPVHRAMTEAAGGKNLWIVGGGELAGQFHDHGLLDEVVVQIAAVTLGGGAPLLPRAITTPPLRLLSATRFGEAFVELRYQVGR